MGKMKELFMESQQEQEADNTFYKGVHDSMIHSLARQSCEEFIPTEDTLCPNCFGGESLHRNKTEAKCVSCGQEFIYIENNVLRYK
tara:strand:+ start:910 stop:1167 length:258 start_codon:yes stop_codon:yes gene_type:complete